MNISDIIKIIEDYKGLHTAPSKENGDPLHNVTQNAYPDDIYTLDNNTAARYYGHGIPEDTQSIAIIQQYKNKPHTPVKIYRAVPKYFNNNEQETTKLKTLINYYNNFGFFPVNNPIINKYQEELSDQKIEYDEKIKIIYNNIMKKIEKDKSEKIKIGINPHDWVTINKQYAINHGKSALNNNYKILSKTVKAKDIYTNGDSIHEWGYDP